MKLPITAAEWINLLIVQQKTAYLREKNAKIIIDDDEARRWNRVAHDLAEDAIWFKKMGGYAG